MGLENLKSVFSVKSQKFVSTDITQMSSEFSAVNSFQNSNVTTMDSSLSNTNNFVNTSVTDIDSIYNDLASINLSSVELLTTTYEISNLLTGPDNLKDKVLSDVTLIPPLDTIQIGPGNTQFQFIHPTDGSKLYDTYTYDPRTAKPRTVIYKNAYAGTFYDNGAGGLFNSEDCRKTSFQ